MRARIATLLVLVGGCAGEVVHVSDGGQDPGQPVKSLPGQELCGNGIDDDRDNAVDEGCSCLTGSEQRCYPGLPRERGRGQCRDGSQRCQGDLELGGSWSACEGAITASPEICGDGIDQDCDGADLPCAGRPADAGPSHAEAAGATCQGLLQPCTTDSQCCSNRQCHQGLCRSLCSAFEPCSFESGKGGCKPDDYCHRTNDLLGVYNGVCMPGGQGVGTPCQQLPFNTCKRGLYCWAKHNRIGDPRVCVPTCEYGASCPSGMTCEGCMCVYPK